MIPVEIFTLSQRLRGSLETKQHRVVDALNATAESYLLLHDAEMTQLTGPLSYVELLTLVKLSKRTISFAIPQEEERDDPARRQQRFFAYTAKDARPVLICLENFEIRGNIHVPRSSSSNPARDTLDLPGGEFVPVTAATIVFLPKPSLAFQADVVIINKAQLAVTGLLPSRVSG